MVNNHGDFEGLNGTGRPTQTGCTEGMLGARATRMAGRGAVMLARLKKETERRGRISPERGRYPLIQLIRNTFMEPL